MTTLTVHLPRPHPAQRDILIAPARFRVVACGRRFGKTELAKIAVTQTLLDGKPAAYFAPTYKMLGQVWRELRRTLGLVTTGVSEQEKRLDIVGGGVLDCWSLDNPDAARGRKYAVAVIDEAAMVRDADAWPAVIRPTLTDYIGRALFLSTPRGHNWFWQLYQLGNDPLEADWSAFRYPSSANPHMPPHELEAARRDLPERLYDQEYLAVFREDAGGVFRRVLESSTLAPQAPQPGARYVFGIDWGRANDYTAIAVIDATTRRQVHLERFTEIGYEVQRGRIKALASRYKPSVIVAEENAMGGPNVEALQADGLPVQAFATTPATKGPLIDALALALERGDVTLLNDAVQVGELQAYELERLPSGAWRYGAPQGGHDDTVIALALAWHGVSYGNVTLGLSIGRWG